MHIVLHFISSHPIPFLLIPPHYSIPSHPISYYLISSNSILFHPILSHPTIPSHSTTPSHLTCCDLVLCDLLTWLSRPSGSAPPGPSSHADALSLPSVAAQCKGAMPAASVLYSFVGQPASAAWVGVEWWGEGEEREGGREGVHTT